MIPGEIIPTPNPVAGVPERHARALRFYRLAAEALGHWPTDQRKAHCRRFQRLYWDEVDTLTLVFGCEVLAAPWGEVTAISQ